MLSFTVLAPILHPVAARPGDVLVVRFGCPETPAVVTRQTGAGWVAVRAQHVTPDALGDCLAAGLITPRVSDDVAA